MLHQKHKGYRAVDWVVMGLEAQSSSSGSAAGSAASRAHRRGRGGSGGGWPLACSLGSASELGTLNDRFKKVLFEEDL